MARQVKIQIVVDAKGGVVSVNGLAVKMDDLGDATKRTGDRLKAMDVAMGDLASKGAQMLLGRLRDLVQAGADLLGMSADIAETQSKFDTVFGQSGKVVQDFADEWTTMAGLTRSQGQDLLSTTGAISQGLGMAREESARFSTEVASLAGDIASFNNAQTPDTLRAITSALTGEREQLKQYGIVVQETDVQLRALQMTGKARAEQLTQAEKATATLALITERAGVAVGDLARTQDSAANKGKQLAAQLGTLQEIAAEELLPAATEINAQLLELASREDVTEAVRAGAKALSDALRVGIDLLTKTINLISEYRQEIRTAAEVVQALVPAVVAYVAATQLYTLWTTRATLAQKALNLAMKLNPVGLVIAGLTALVMLYLKFKDRVDAAAGAVLDWGANVLRTIQNMVQKLRDFLVGSTSWMGRFAVGVDAMTAGLGLLEKGLDAGADAMERQAEKLRASTDETQQLAEETEQLGETADDTAGSLNNLGNSAGQASAALKAATQTVKDLKTELADLLKADPARLAALQQEADALLKQIEARKALIELMARGDDPEALRTEIDLSPTKEMQQHLDGIQAMRERDLERQRAHDEAMAASSEAAQQRIQESQEASAAASADAIARQVSAQQALRDQIFETAQAQALAAGREIRTAADVANAVVDAVRQQVAAYLAKAIAAVLAESLVALGPAAPFLGAAAAAFIAGSLTLLFNQFVPMGRTNVSRGGASASGSAGAPAPTRSGVPGGGGSSNDTSAGGLYIPGRRRGGSVAANRPYLVGEGPGGTIIPGITELFVPSTNGSVVPGNVLASMGRPQSDPALRGELRALRSDMQNMHLRLEVEAKNFNMFELDTRLRNYQQRVNGMLGE